MVLSNRKFKKFFAQPGLFWRDYLLKRFPIAFPTSIPSPPSPDISVVENQDCFRAHSVEDLLSGFNLGITSRVSRDERFVDISSVSFLLVVNALHTFCRAFPGRILIYAAKRRVIDLASPPTNDTIRAMMSAPSLELVVVNEDGVVSLRRRLLLWGPSGNVLETRSNNTPVKRVAISSDGVVPPPPLLTDLSDTDPIDVVYTWVNSRDADWVRMLREHKDVAEIDPDRFSQVDELKYSVRSLALYIPWVRRVFFLSNCAPPDWFVESDRYRWVWHHDIMPAEMLPTFNSHAIETMLHKIPGLSNKFIYMNDDFFLSDFADPRDFFCHRGRSVSRLEPYGTVSYLAQLAESNTAEEWQFAAVNSARLIERDYGFFPSRMHRHVPYALDKQVFEAIEERYPEEMERVRLNRFRNKNDISFGSFFYHHFAIAEGKAVERDELSYIVRNTNLARFERMMSKAEVPRFFCINDGGGSSRDDDYNKFKMRFLNSAYPYASPAEQVATEFVSR